MPRRRLENPLRPALFQASREVLVMAVLADGRLHAAGLADRLEQQAGLRLRPGTLYPTLAALARRGWLRSTLKNPGRGRLERREVELTAEGRRALRTRAAEWAAYLARLQGVVLPAVRTLAAREARPAPQAPAGPGLVF